MSISNQIPTPEMLRKLLDYDPDTGLLVWKHRTADMHPNDQGRRLFNKRWAGTLAFTSNNNYGYKRGKVFGIKHMQFTTESGPLVPLTT
jgi:hypothetical protein